MSKEIKLLENYKNKQKALYDRICKIKDIDGTFELLDDNIIWRRNCSVFLSICTDTIQVYKNKFLIVTHWHCKDDDEILEEIALIGKKGNILVAYKNLFSDGVCYMGKAGEYKTKKPKFIFGRKYIFGDKLATI